MRELIAACSLLEESDAMLFQLIDSGLCTYRDLIDGTLTFRDVIKLLEYSKVKLGYASWKLQHQENERKARKFVR